MGAAAGIIRDMGAAMGVIRDKAEDVTLDMGAAGAEAEDVILDMAVIGALGREGTAGAFFLLVLGGRGSQSAFFKAPLTASSTGRINLAEIKSSYQTLPSSSTALKFLHGLKERKVIPFWSWKEIPATP
ncbi:hypothetical protein Pyn_01504 [Prunus yedoensis var. nudiflora]|uniref:Uncharacterized protein n=1 Tax=Prunus yedoensis var. nudiflora TaxID=2094558 RepID=A0A314U9B1_PRUYE|nr:hypothetical protein Pyn_01504 [Prunus yedoensis var. nudiflora]